MACVGASASFEGHTASAVLPFPSPYRTGTRSYRQSNFPAYSARGRVPVRCGSIPRLTYRLLQGKKTYTRGPAWSSRSPLTPGDALDIGRVNARYLLRP